jgi:hypothetical protein
VNQKVLLHMLRQVGHDTTCVTLVDNGPDAIKRVLEQQQPFDLILLVKMDSFFSACLFIHCSSMYVSLFFIRTFSFLDATDLK